MDNISVSHGVPCTVAEVAFLQSGESVRVVGTLKLFDAKSSQAILEHNSSGVQILIDTRLLDHFNFRIGSLFEFIGEVKVDNNKACVWARVYNNVDGLDISLYERVLHLRRLFLEEW